MSNLEEEIAKWRARMTAALPDEEETVRELETHLRDHIETLGRSGVAPEIACAEGVQRIGEPKAIAGEFRELRTWRPASLPVVIVLGIYMLLIIVWTFEILTHFSKGEARPLWMAHVLAISAGYLSLVATGMLGICALVMAWRTPLSRRQRTDFRGWIFRLTVLSSSLVPLGIVLGMIWMARHHNRVWSWKPTETGAFFIVLATALLLFAQTRFRTNDRVRWVLAVVGSVAVAIGWFGASAETLSVPIPWLTIAFAASQIAVMMLWPSGSFATTRAIE